MRGRYDSYTRRSRVLHFLNGGLLCQIEKLYDDFKHLKSSMKDRFTEGSPTWKSMALFPTPESLKNFLTSALSFLGEGVWDYEPMLNFLDNVPQKSFISEIKIGKLMKKVFTILRTHHSLQESNSAVVCFVAGGYVGNSMRGDGEIAFSIAGKL